MGFLDDIEGLGKLEEERRANVPDRCPYCGADLPTDSEEDTIKCEYCGSRFDNSNSKAISDSVYDVVEKQQKLEQERKQKELEQRMLKNQEEAQKRAARRKHSFLRNVILIVLIVFIVMFCYYNYMV